MIYPTAITSSLHLCTRTEKLKEDQDTEEEKREYIERSTAGILV